MAEIKEPTEFKMNETTPETFEDPGVLDEESVIVEPDTSEIDQDASTSGISKFAPEVQKSDDVETHVTASQLTDDTLQNIIDDAASSDPNADEEDKKKKRFSLPSLTVDSFYNRKHLKRKVRVLIGLYIIGVIVPLGYKIVKLWQEDRSLNQSWDIRNVQYVAPLQSIDLSDLSMERVALFSAFQETRDPLYSLYITELIANENKVNLVFPSYNFSSSLERQKQGAIVETVVTGDEKTLLAFFEELQSVRPFISINHLVAGVGNESEAEEGEVVDPFRVTLELEFALVPELSENRALLESKIMESEQIAYPISRIKEVMDIVEKLRQIPFFKRGENTIGKDNPFAT